MTGKKAPKGEVSGERVLEAAAHLFRERGYLATSVREIALIANMKSGSIYYHYPSKEALLEAVMNQALLALIESMTVALAEVGEEAPFEDRLRAAVSSHLRTIHLYGDYAVTSRQSLDLMSKDRHDAHMRLRIQYGGMWRSIFELARNKGELGPDVDIVPLEMLIIGSLNWTHEWLDPKRRSLDELSSLLSTIVAKGVLPSQRLILDSGAKRKTRRRAFISRRRAVPR